MAESKEPDPLVRRRLRPLGAAGGLFALIACGCVGPGAYGLRDTAPSPNTFWVPSETDRPKVRAPASPEVPPELADRRWSLGDVVDLALRNNPATRAAWQDARAAAASYASQRGGYFPTINLNAGLNVRSSSVSGGTPPSGSGAASGGDSTTFGPTVSLSWLLFDFGSRSGSVENARQSLLALNWAQNATIQATVLSAGQAYFQYMTAKATLEARKASLRDAQLNFEAASARHEAGVATIADVLQAKTALSQSQLTVQTVDGIVQTTRGSLAVSMGFPANLPFDIEEMPGEVPLEGITRTVEDLITQALENRPSLLAARAQVLASEAQVKKAQGDALPTLTLNSSGGRTYFDSSGGSSGHSDAYGAGLALNVPLFTGFSQSNNIERAKAQSRAASERQKGLEQQVIFQVYADYYALQTAAQTSRTADDLVTSAEQSVQVALGRYKEGVGTILDLTTAQSALADARARRILARWGWYTSLAQLAHDTGLLDLQGNTPIKPSSAAPRDERSQGK